MPARTVTLELLRHGPSHNQLLSPLTPYLALCGNHDAETVHVGFEHMQFMRRLRGLRYQDGRPAEGSALEEAADEVSRLMASIRSLTAEISSAPHGGQRIIHLRLVLSASELAMLPFELIRSPAGFPGQGQWLSLQTVAPIVVTREVRRVPASTVKWPERPRILVVAAAPEGLPEVPLRAHLLALRRALDPWLVTSDERGLASHVTVLPRATLTDVREACAHAAGKKEPYTHVHVLAHGLEPDDRGVDSHFGIALHADGDRDKKDLVIGSRLAAALRCHPSSLTEGQLASPTVVTVASCDSGNVGSVVAPGASIAHDLHEAGIPLVFASQFPLSMRGSAIMAEVVYQRLLRGDDPRTLVHDLRQKLHVECPETHDWASVVAYAALPDDIEAQVRHAKFARALAALYAAIKRHDAVKDAHSVEGLSRSMEWLKSALPGNEKSSERARAHGVLAHAAKRVAHVTYAEPLWPFLGRKEGTSLEEEDAPDNVMTESMIGGGATAGFVASTLSDLPPPPRTPSEAGAKAQTKARRLLEEARRAYLEVWRRGTSEAWPIVQYLALGTALMPFDRALPPAMREDAQREYTGWWTLAHTAATDNLRSKHGQPLVWGHSALVELYVLAQLLPDDHWARRDTEARAVSHVTQLMQIGTPLDCYSLRLQLLRYVDWWWQDRDVIKKLPASLNDLMRDAGVDLVPIEDR